MTLLGYLPASLYILCSSPGFAPPNIPCGACCLCGVQFFSRSVRLSMRVSSILSAPTPLSNTLSIQLPLNGLRAITIGS